jgi:ABC-type molybdate transport system substrate-binding protein
MKFAVVFLASFFFVVGLGYLALKLRPDAVNDSRLPAVIHIYCAAGVAAPVGEIVKAYNDEQGTRIEIVRTGGSGELAGQLKAEFETGLIGGADLYITADDQLMDKAQAEQIVARQFRLAGQKPVIAVAADGDLQIPDLGSLLSQSDLRFGIASDRAAIGRLIRRIADQQGRLAELEAAKTIDAENVMTLAQALVTGSLDAAIVWDATVTQINQEERLLKIANFPDANNDFPSDIVIGVTTRTESPQQSLRFAKYLQDSRFARQIFEEYGYTNHRD